jgi:hypothetical protein
MPEHKPQRYVAYRASSDEFEIRFFGGPLDGARIQTDIFPDCETFLHRVRGRSYSYRYEQVSSLRFHATLDQAAATVLRPKPGNRLAKLVVITTLVVLAVLTAVAGLWLLPGP